MAYVAGFPGVGKTTWCNNNSLYTHDSDSSSFSKLEDGSPNPNFIVDYFRQLENMQYIPGLMVFVSTHEDVLAELKNRDMDFYIIIPHESLLDEYVKRYEGRGSPQPLIDLIVKNWYVWLADIKSKYKYFELKSGETVSSFMVETYETGHDGANAVQF